MEFLFRKYKQEEEPSGSSQREASGVESEEHPDVPPAEFRLFPPSPKAQLVLIAVGFVVLNLILMVVLAIGLYVTMS